MSNNCWMIFKMFMKKPSKDQLANQQYKPQQKKIIKNQMKYNKLTILDLITISQTTNKQSG